MNIKDNVFIKLLKDNTTIDTKFINTFFKKIKVGSELDFDIKDFHVAKYLEVSLINIRRRLNNEYSKSSKFIEKDTDTTAIITISIKNIPITKLIKIYKAYFY